jgi:hypothetical protein
MLGREGQQYRKWSPLPIEPEQDEYMDLEKNLRKKFSIPDDAEISFGESFGYKTEPVPLLEHHGLLRLYENTWGRPSKQLFMELPPGYTQEAELETHEVVTIRLPGSAGRPGHIFRLHLDDLNMPHWQARLGLSREIARIESLARAVNEAKINPEYYENISKALVFHGNPLKEPLRYAWFLKVNSIFRDYSRAWKMENVWDRHWNGVYISWPAVFPTTALGERTGGIEPPQFKELLESALRRRIQILQDYREELARLHSGKRNYWNY